MTIGTIIIAIAIIVGLGSLVVAGIGLSGFGVQQWGWQVEALNNLGQTNSIIMMAVGGGSAIACLVALIVARIKNQQNYTMTLPLSDRNQILVPSEEIKKRGLDDLIHEACELTAEGDLRICSLERLKEILEDLRNRNSLDALNTIPDQHTIPQTSYRQGLTPLQYWVNEGNLKAVELLVEFGAQDYCRENSDNQHMKKSALYVAIECAYLPIVNYLLQKGATANVAFANNALLFFIPTLIYRLPYQAFDLKSEQTLQCLEQTLESLAKTDPENLKLQLQIPVGKDTDNILDHVLALHTYAEHTTNPTPIPYPIKTPLIALLRKFGAQEHVCVSLEELKALGYEDGGGFTLSDIARFK